MPKRMKIPPYAKVSAKKGLENRKKSSLTPKESRDLGVYSGIAKADKIIKNKFLDERDLRSISKFYKKNKDKTNKKNEDVFLLWGGRRFGLFLSKIY